MKKIQEFEDFLGEAKSTKVDFNVFMDCLIFTKSEFNDLYYKDKEEFSSMKAVIERAKEVASNCKIEKEIDMDEFPQGYSIKKSKHPNVFMFHNPIENSLVIVSSTYPNLDKMIDPETYDFNER